MIAAAFLAGSAVLVAAPVTAQDGCVAEVEPNDTEDVAGALEDGGCLVGTLPSGDQDLVILTLDDAATTRTWDLTLEGIRGTATLLQLYQVTSEPGASVLAVERTPAIELSTSPDGPSMVDVHGALLPPERFLVGIGRSSTLDGGEPRNDDYLVRIEPGALLPPPADDEPNDDFGSAAVLEDAFEVSGDRQGSRHDYIAWEVTEPDGRWKVTLQTPLGEEAGLDLIDAGGSTVVSTRGGPTTVLYDLALGPGRYGFRIRETGDRPSPYILRTEPSSTSADPEPNDGAAQPVAILEGTPVKGRLAIAGDRDRFVLDVPPGEPVLRDVRMLWRSGASRTLCLLDIEGQSTLWCRRANDGLNLSGLLLEAGAHTFEVWGPEDPADVYVIRIDTTGPVVPDFEAEPNDEPTRANDMDPTLGMRGRGADGDIDFYRLRTTGAPRVWDVELAGARIKRLELVQASGQVRASGEVARDGAAARLSDLHLAPGDHWLKVQSEGLEYSLSATPLGPPDPDGEREPNDKAEWAERYVVGERLVGRLPLASDRDFLRLTAAAPQRVGIDLELPDDAAVGMRLWTGGKQVLAMDPGPAGASASWDFWLEAGDHHLELVPETPSEGFYELTSELLDPFAAAVDQEPNDKAAWARPVPPSLTWTGSPADARDTDWFVLPATIESEPFVMRTEGEVLRVRAQESVPGVERDGSVTLDRGDDGTFTSTSPLTVGGRVLLAIESTGPYEATVTGGGWLAAPPAPPIPLELAWTLPVEAVAAYWPGAQGFDATISLSNGGGEDLSVELETSTSHYLWSTSEPMPVDVPAGATVTIDVPILVGPDAWGTDDVQLAARAISADGARASAVTSVAVSPEAPAVTPRPGWNVPSPLLGGLNVAALALGAEPTGTIDPDEERRLFDGATPEGPTGQADQQYGNGFSVFITDHVEGLPLELVVDLAGDAPVPVAGTIINPQASQGDLDEIPRDFELLLSSDGTTWSPAYQGTLSPLRLDQAFVVDPAAPATHAMLRIWSKYDDPAAYVSLGEWKVVAEPGFDPSGEPRDIADPALGGHVVVFEPFDDDPEMAWRILDAGTERDTVDTDGAHTLEITLGFADDRAARIDRLGWRDPERSQPDQRLETAEIHGSLDAPGGPWRFLGTWELERGPDGSVAPFVLDEPTWARYVQIRGRLPAGAEELELPADLSVFEQPTDEHYRSVVGEWGYRSSNGPYEALIEVQAPPLTAEDPADDATTATPLAPGVTISERVEIDADVDWYALEVPDDHDTLDLIVDGDPFVGVALTLSDQAGSVVDMPFRIAPDGSVRYRAAVEPGMRYDLKVEQPPFSVAFAFDTSPSMAPFITRVTEGLRSFLSDVRPGREVATLLPFDEAPLLDGWSDDRYRLRDAFENHVVEGSGSSSAEAALISASSALAEQEGARAIMLVTDGETSSYEDTPDLWTELARVRPVIFSVHVGGLIEPVASRQRMQDWAFSSGGHYSYPTTAGEMDQAFERMATWLRRPAAYTLGYETLELRPATLALVSPTEGGPTAALPMAPGVGVEVILDTSGSMRKRLDGKRRIQVAKTALRRLLTDTLAEGTPVTIRTFGAPGKGREANCGTTQALPLGPLDRDDALEVVKGLSAGKKTGTPIAAALDAVTSDLAGVSGLRSVVLISDGAASCDGDPRKSIGALREAGVEVKIDVVGFALKDDALKAEMAEWAALGGGAYYDAGDARELARSISSALSAPYRAAAIDGSSSAAGTIDGPPTELEPGTYRIEVLTEPPRYIDEVELANGESLVLTIEPEAE